MSLTSYLLPMFSRKGLLAFVLHVGVIVSILFSFQLSTLFELESQRVHILSFTAALISALFLRFRSSVFIGICLGQLIHYLFISGREPAVAIAFSIILPTVVYLLSRIYLRATQSLPTNELTFRAIYYLCTMVVIYPVVMTVVIVLVSTAFNYPFMDDLHVYGYAILSSALTQILLTPICFALLSCLSSDKRTTLLTLDKEMRAKGENQHLYRLWVTISSIILLSAFMANDLLTLNALCIILVPVIGLGLGGFGYIQPCMLTFGLAFISTYSAVNAFDAEQITLETFYSLIAILFTITSVIFLMVAQSVKSHLTLRAIIQKERKDPYTGLFTLSQLKEDASFVREPTLVSIDLVGTTRRLKTLGLAGKKELVTQLAKYLSQHHSLCDTAYVAPFTTSLVYLTDRQNIRSQQLRRIHQLIRDFDFTWHQRSIKILAPKVKYGYVLPEQDIAHAVSTLCSPEHESATFEITSEVNLEQRDEQSITKLSQIQAAFDDNIFELYCQPYRYLQGQRRNLSFEVLLRLPQQNGGEILTPAEFFPLIHEFGLEVELDKWVIKNTFKTLKAYVTNWDSIGSCCINLTAQALTHIGLSEQIEMEAKEYEIPLNKICFEITESMPLDNELQASLNISALQDKGCMIALDDFGTGYASFDYLRRIPVNILKIDGSFVSKIHVDDTDRAIVSNISQIAQNMGLKTVAEFVETDEHADILTELNIHYAQGFGIAKPRPLIEELKRLFG